MTYTTREAIPRTRGVLVHLTTITEEIQKMFEATYYNNKPFFIFYSSEIKPFDEHTEMLIKNQPHFIDEIIYSSEEEALQFLDYRIDELLKLCH